MNKFITMLVSSFNLSQSFNYAPYLFCKKLFKSDINCFCILTPDVSVSKSKCCTIIAKPRNYVIITRFRNNAVLRVKWRRPRRARNYSAAATQLVLCLRFALLKGESWLRTATLDYSKTPTPVLHNTSVVVWNLYCVRVIIVRLNKRSKSRGFVHN